MTTPKLITVLLAEDHALVRQGLSALLIADGGFQLIGEARNGREAVKLAARLKPDVILMDIAMPILNGLEATRQVLTASPAARILILSAHSDDLYVERMREAGVAGFLEKHTSAEVLAEAIREAAGGRTFFSSGLIQRPPKSPGKRRHRIGVSKARGHRLTPRESEVLQLVAEGWANQQVAAELGISIKTVAKHRHQLMEKLNLQDTAGLTRYAIAQGIIESNMQVTMTD